MKPFKCIIFFMIFSLVGSIAKACEPSLLGKRSRSPEEFPETSQPPKKRQKISFPCRWKEYGCKRKLTTEWLKALHDIACKKNPGFPIECLYCKKGNYADIKRLMTHVKACQHNPNLSWQKRGLSFPCKWKNRGCEKQFHYNRTKKEHESICTKNPSNPSQCCHCGRNDFATIGPLNKHIIKCKHNQNIQSKPKKPKSLPCKWKWRGCKKLFILKDSKGRHENICTKNPSNPSQCCHCGRDNFATTGHLRNHEKKCQKRPVTKIANSYSQTAQSLNSAAVNSANSNKLPPIINPSPDTEQDRPRLPGIHELGLPLTK